MMGQYSEEDGSVERIKPVEARKYIATWAADSWNAIPKAAVKNSWRHKPFSYFPEESTEAYVFSDEDDSGDEEISIMGL